VSRFGKRLLSIVVLMLIGILLGMQLAGGGLLINTTPSQNISTVAGTEPAVPATRLEPEQPAQPEQQEVKERPFVPVQTPSQVLGAEQDKAPVDVLAEKTAGLLQNLSHSGIKWVVSLFSGVAE